VTSSWFFIRHLSFHW